MDNRQPRKASDIILSLEAKMDKMMALHATLDLNLKVLSNKMTEMMRTMNTTDNISMPQNIPTATATAIDTFPNYEGPQEITISSSENQKTVEKEPVGFRRTSRPETFDRVSEPTEGVDMGRKISVVQRIVDKTGKAIFAAGIEVIEHNSREKIWSGRSDAIGKYRCRVLPGTYQIVIKKQDNITKEKIELSQNIIVDGHKDIIELPILIAK